MDISLTKLTRPGLEARFCPIYWEPQAGGNERITSLIAIIPSMASSAHFPAAAHCILSEQKCRAMLGAVRGNSAHGILSEAAKFMSQQLGAGLDLEDLTAPFTGFSVGGPRTVRGFSVEQLLTAAVQMVSTLGSADELTEDILPIDSRLTTATTREFLKSVKKIFTGNSKSLKSRFNHKHQAPGSPDVTLDYQHNQWLVQFASLPSNTYQENRMQSEAESKMFEIITAQSTIDAPTKPLLIINSQALSTSANLSPDGQLIAKMMLQRFTGLASVHKVATYVATDEFAAVRQLETLG